MWGAVYCTRAAVVGGVPSTARAQTLSVERRILCECADRLWGAVYCPSARSICGAPSTARAQTLSVGRPARPIKCPHLPPSRRASSRCRPARRTRLAPLLLSRLSTDHGSLPPGAQPSLPSKRRTRSPAGVSLSAARRVVRSTQNCLIIRGQRLWGRAGGPGCSPGCF